MFEKLSNSWSLVKASWNVLLADKELIVFPIVSMIGAIIVTATFVVPAMLSGILGNMAAGDQGSRILGGIVAFLFYVVLYTVIFFCNTALVGAAMMRLRGEDPTLKDGFRIATSHIKSIIGYALIAATVGMILRWMRDKGILGRLAAGMFGLAWNIATYLVVPILAIENVGPIEAVKRSTALLKKTWGEQLVGNIGIGLVFGLIFFFTFLGGIIAIVLAISTQSVPLIATVAGGWVLLLVALGLISSALSGIYTAAVYQYATSGTPGAFFSANQVQNAFRLK